MKIYLGDMFHPDAVEWLRQRAEVVQDFDHIEELDGILIRAGGVAGEQIRKAKNLKVIGRHGVGFETVDVAAAKEQGVRVLNVPRGNAHSVAEYIVTLFLAMSRRLYESNLRIRRDEIHAIAAYDYRVAVDPTELMLGTTGCHSAFLPLFRRVAEEEQVSLLRLIADVSAIDRKAPTEALLRQVAATLK